MNKSHLLLPHFFNLTSETVYVGCFALLLMFSLLLVAGNLSYAQSDVTSSEISPAPTSGFMNDTVRFNTYKNSEVGISIQYPSNFLIDEDNSNESLKQISFFPAVNNSPFSSS